MGPVLIGLDGSPEAVAALHWGAWFASRTGGHLQVAHVWPHGRKLELPAALAGDDTWVEGEGPDGLRERLAEAAAEALDEVTVPIEGLVLRGPISGALLEQASRHENALIAVGAMGEGGALRSMLGSVSRELTEQPPRTGRGRADRTDAAAGWRLVDCRRCRRLHQFIAGDQVGGPSSR